MFQLGLKTRVFVLFVAGVFAYSWYWAAFESPRSHQARGDASCRTSTRTVAIRVSVSHYPDNWRHIVDARHGHNTAADGSTIIDNGLRWPVLLTKNDTGEEQRRQAAFRLAGVTTTKPGMARDEYPPAEGRRSDSADIRYVPSRQNSAQGASMGGQLRKWCNGTHYRLVAAP